MKPVTIASFVAAFSLFAAPLIADAQDAAASSATDVYKPAGPWAVDYGDDYCRLARNFSDGTNTMALALERISPGPDMRLLLVGPDLKLYRSAETIGWRFTPDDLERQARATHSQTADGKQWYNLGEVRIASAPSASPATFTPPGAYDPGAEQTAAKGKTGILVDGSLTAPVQIETGDLASPIAALQACAEDLAKSWGVDARTMKTPPIPTEVSAMPANVGQMFQPAWLPQGTIQFADFGKLAGGSNQVRLMVDSTGKPTSCVIHWATLDAATNSNICKILMDKAKFTPAKDPSGAPIAGYWIGSPMFMVPPLRGARGR